METSKLIVVLRQHNAGCFSCGHEHNCRDGHCALMQQAADTLECLLTKDKGVKSMEELKSCPSQWDVATKYLNAYRNSHYNDSTVNDSYWLAQAINEILPFAVNAHRRAEPENQADLSEEEPLCTENENFIQNKFGWCFYSLGPCPLIYNLYVHSQYRRKGHSKSLLSLAIHIIRESGYDGKIFIEASPAENSIGQADLEKYYRRMGLTIYDADWRRKVDL